MCPFDDGRCYRSCIQPGRCAYSYVFETPLSEEIATIFAPIRGALDAPHPFVLEPPEEEKQHYSAQNRRVHATRHRWRCAGPGRLLGHQGDVPGGQGARYVGQRGVRRSVTPPGGEAATPAGGAGGEASRPGTGAASTTTAGRGPDPGGGAAASAEPDLTPGRVRRGSQGSARFETTSTQKVFVHSYPYLKVTLLTLWQTYPLSEHLAVEVALTRDGASPRRKSPAASTRRAASAATAPPGATPMCTSGYSAQGWCYALDQAREAIARVSNQYESRHQQ